MFKKTLKVVYNIKYSSFTFFLKETNDIPLKNSLSGKMVERVKHGSY